MMVAARSKSLLAMVALSVILFSSTSFAAPKNTAGSTCKKSGTTQTVAGKSYVCATVSKKLVWKLKPAAVPVPSTLTGPTWAQIAAEKAAADKVAEDLRIKLEAEAKAAAELKAKLEAEAKVAKAEAERPKVAGLTIGNLLWADDFAGSTGSSIDQKKWTARNCHRTPETFGGGACFDSEVVYYAP